jgi:hypothetical protein
MGGGGRVSQSLCDDDVPRTEPRSRPRPVRVLADDKPVRIGRFKGLVGSTYVRGAYGFNPGGQGGPYSALPSTAPTPRRSWF